jgi:imidazole glycerol-phosphate synthase subunit HisH
MKIAIIDYGVGNPGSVLNMFKRIGVDAYISDNPRGICNAQKLILPGVGSFDTGMLNLNNSGLLPDLNRLVMIEKRPILGICLGMQLMTNTSEEGALPGLGWIDAETVKFKFDSFHNFKIPHMSWNLASVRKENILFDEEKSEKKFYFVHSYYVKCNDDSDILTETNYGINFTSSFQRENIVGVQFHPEKSHRFGFRFMENFAKVFN